MHKELICMMIIVKKKTIQWSDLLKKYLFSTKEDSSRIIKEQKTVIKHEENK